MAHLVFWPTKIFFYPIGNTPAVCLTSELPPEQSAHILSLGCGDARNLLYTVYANLASRSLDFTCCDIDPAVLARNAILYTLLMDLSSEQTEDSIQKIWNFYYHFFIDQETLDMVLKQCQFLIGLSPDVVTWNNSKYGAILRFSSALSLSAVRRHWELYVETKDFSKAEKESLHSDFRKNQNTDRFGGLEHGFNVTSNRSAGPLFRKMRDTGSKQFQRYWKTGVTFDDPVKVAAATEVNPTFAYSAMGRGFALHYGSDPILSFHLAKALAPVNDLPSNAKTISISDLVKCAMEEFQSWCLAFNKRIKGQRPSIMIRILVGDAIAACRALHYCAVNDSIESGLYTKPWSSALMILDGGDYVQNASHRAPLHFDVIDTSNLTDHLGLLNVLISCRPLMQRRPSSVIFTDTLHPSNEEGIGRNGFLELLCGDVSTVSIILDLIPVSYVSNFTTHANVHEIVPLASSSSVRQLHEHTAWRIGSMSDSLVADQESHTDQRLKFDHQQLAGFFYRFYLSMFSDENMGALLQSGLSLQQIRKQEMVHYNRFCLAYILRLVKDSVDTDWDGFVNRLHDLIFRDKNLLLGSNNIQDMFCAFYLLGVYSFSPFSPKFFVDRREVKDSPIRGWKDLPPAVCISVQVPRKHFRVLEKSDADKIGTPFLLCSLLGVAAHNTFQHYQCFFGRLRAEYSDDPSQEPKVTFEDDPKGFQGSSSIIFSFYLPTWILGIEPSQKVTISVRSNPVVIASLYPTLGPLLILFSADLADRKYVHITRERPGNPGELQKLRNVTFSRPGTPLNSQPLCDAVKIHLDSASGQVLVLTGHANILDTNAKSSLASGAVVTCNQTSPQAMQVSIGNYLHIIPYPFPIDSINSKTRIARKSSYIEVDVQISHPLGQKGMTLKPFPIVKHNNVLSLWNVHYIDLDRLPVLDLSSPDELSFVQTHVGMSFSDRERRISRLPGSNADVMTRLKQSIQLLFLNSCGLGERKSPWRIFGLSDPDDCGVYTLIFINGVCLDLSSHTIVIDACVVPLTLDCMPHLFHGIYNIHKAGVIQIITDAEEVKAWKLLLPAYTERCRKWGHSTRHCEYLSKGIPVSEEIDQTPLCRCGQGKDLGRGFSQQHSEWKDFAPFATRAAISPLFSATFIDTFGVDIFKKEDSEACTKCHGPGKPKLMSCAACKAVRYCSVDCQKADWKTHKRSCKKI